MKTLSVVGQKPQSEMFHFLAKLEDLLAQPNIDDVIVDSPTSLHMANSTYAVTW
jgi:predicted dehydrogenase